MTEITIVKAKCRPILFQDVMIRAILMGVKTQTRRIVNPEIADKPCPYGVAGDTLWVRECWQKLGDEFIYRASAPGGHSKVGLWKPSIHMPREACRLELKIIGTFLEPLHDINKPDALAEGTQSVAAFKSLWQTLHGQKSWDLNPDVWVIEFKVKP
jgi:hypothetical protein